MIRTETRPYRIRPFGNGEWMILNNITYSVVFRGTHAECVSLCLNGAL